VSDKGCLCILEALHILKSRNIKPNLTIIGDGPEKDKLVLTTNNYGLDNQVIFKGSLIGVKLNDILNQHKILIVPSLWHEPFGKVALEGLAAGCSVIVSDVGGLKEAAGSFSLTFEKGDADQLAKKIEEMLTKKIDEKERRKIQEHLNAHTITSIGKRYIDFITEKHFSRHAK
jgi:glycosyltransferase involved in cell wall biosynthesis